MTSVATLVLATVNAPYGTSLSAHQLAAMIVDPKSASEFSAPVFAFFSDVSTTLQKDFLADMGVDAKQASKVAGLYEQTSGYSLALAA